MLWASYWGSRITRKDLICMRLFNFFKKGEKEEKIKKESVQFKANKESNTDEPQDAENVLYSEYRIAKVLEYIIVRDGIILSENPDDYPRWMSYECDIKNPYKMINALIQSCYLETSNQEQTLNMVSTSDLKEILKNNGIKEPKRRKDLIQTLLQNVDISSIDLPKVYVSTKKGKDFVDAHRELLDAGKLKRFSITIEQYYEKKNSLPGYMKFNDTVWAILCDKSYEYTLNKNFGYMQNAFLYMAEFLSDEKKYCESLKYYVYVLYYSMCIDIRPRLFENDLKKDNSLPPGIVDHIYKLREYFNPNMIKKCYLLYVPEDSYRAPSKQDFEREVMNIIDNE